VCPAVNENNQSPADLSSDHVSEDETKFPLIAKVLEELDSRYTGDDFRNFSVLGPDFVKKTGYIRVHELVDALAEEDNPRGYLKAHKIDINPGTFKLLMNRAKKRVKDIRLSRN
jgi:hypothetical protein